MLSMALLWVGQAQANDVNSMSVPAPMSQHHAKSMHSAAAMTIQNDCNLVMGSMSASGAHHAAMQHDGQCGSSDSSHLAMSCCGVACMATPIEFSLPNITVSRVASRMAIFADVNFELRSFPSSLYRPPIA